MKRIFTVLAIICVIFLPSCEYEAAETESNSQILASSQMASSTVEQSIYSDDIVSMSFINVQDMPTLEGMFLLNVKVKNNSDEEFTIYLQDVSVNDKMVQLGSGMPYDVMPSKESNCSFSGKDSVVEISSAEEIAKIEFKICIMDESTSAVETTEPITINI